VPQLVTAAEYGGLDIESACELVRGRVIELLPHKALHGYACTQLAFHLQSFLRESDLGRAFLGVGVVTERDPDTVRTADVVFESYAYHPRHEFRDEFLVRPELVIEVQSADDRHDEMLARVAEYLESGVMAVVVVDPAGRTATIHLASESVVRVAGQAEIVVADILPGFRLSAEKCFPE
jgi:Uma2 family endonuclease